jgi:hypothetical protein
MSDRCARKGFYLQGVKVVSGAAIFDADGSALAVVVGREAAAGEIAAKDLPDGALLRLPAAGDMPLRFVRSEMHGRVGRAKFDPSAVPADHRDAYTALAVESMALGAKESADYVTEVLRACALTPGPLTTQALLARCRRVLDPGFQQYDETEGARLLAHLVSYARAGEAVPLDWVEERLSTLTDWGAFAVLSAPGTLPAATEDAMLSFALDRIRGNDPDALSDHPWGVLDGSRSDAERVRLRGDLLRYLAERHAATLTTPVPGSSRSHRDLLVDAFYRAALLDEPHPVDPVRAEELRVRAETDVDDFASASPHPDATRSRGPSVPRPPSKNARRKEALRHPSMAVLEREEAEARRALAARLRELDAGEETVQTYLADPAQGTFRPADAADAAEIADLVARLGRARASRVDAEERRFARAESLGMNDSNRSTRRERGQRPRRPALVTVSIADLEDRVELVCEGLLGFLPDEALDRLPPAARPVASRRAAESAENHRTELARSFERESRVRRTGTAGSGASLFDHRYGAVSFEGGFVWGGVHNTENVSWELPAPREGSEEARLLEDPLFLRARVVHAALAPADDRFLEDVRLLVLAGGVRTGRARMTADQAWQTVRNLETALFSLVALTGIWRGGEIPSTERSRRDDNHLAANPEDERSLLLPSWARDSLRSMREGTLRLGVDPLRASFSCLAALRELEFRWQRLRREVQGAMATPVIRKSKERTAEYQASMPHPVPKGFLRRATQGSQGSPSGKPGGKNRRSAKPRNATPARQPAP